MTIPIFNSIYPKYQKDIISSDVNINILNNLNLEQINEKRFPVIKIID